MKKEVQGVILYLSCHKHLNGRVRDFVPPEKEINDWPIHVIIGNPFIQSEYIMFDRLIIIKCEDSYAHLMKKLVLSYKILQEIYNIEQGIIRIADDIEINKKNLISFLNSQKEDYMGRKCDNSELGPVHADEFISNYFKERPNELLNPLNGLHNTRITREIVPSCKYVAGIITYLSRKSCSILIEFMNSIKYNIFHETKHGRPLTIEDMGIGYVLQIHGINPTFRDDFWVEFVRDEKAIGFHTNVNR